jgi:hypothetical protein
VFDASGLDSPVVAVQDLENGEERLRPLRIETEVVDRIVRSAPGELALLIGELNELHYPVEVDYFAAGHLAQASRELEQALHRISGGVALQAADRLGHSDAAGRRRHDLGLAAAPPE